LEACAQIRERLSEIKGLGHPNQYGLFNTDEDPKKGVWLEPGRTLEHYLLRDNVSTQITDNKCNYCSLIFLMKINGFIVKYVKTHLRTYTIYLKVKRPTKS